MKRVAKWLGIGVGGLLALVIVLTSGFYARGRMVIGSVAEAAGTPVAPAALDDSVVLARGEHVVQHIAQCIGCHGPDMGGGVFIDDGAFGVLPAPNLTAGQGGVASAYDADAWERAIRHGVAADGRPLLMMPSHNYQHMSDSDLAAVVAWVRTLPAVDRDNGERRIGPVLGLLTGAGLFKPAPRMIDHAAVGGAAPPEGPTAEYGRYLVTMASCSDCHGANLDGVQESPGPPMAPSLMADTSAASWTVEQFRHAFREGTRPNGTQIDATHMPWPMYGRMTDMELEAVWQYLRMKKGA